jgi:predicted nucleic acid-binding protein
MAERSRTIVLDASAGLKLVRVEEGRDDAFRIAAAAGRICVPSFFWLEIVNVLVRRHGWPGAGVIEAVHGLEALGIETLEADRAALLAVIDLVERHDLTAYDAAYLALALSLDAEIATADRGLARAAGDRAIAIGGDGGVAEEPADYRPRTPSWPSWADAGAYLAELRAAGAPLRGG